MDDTNFISLDIPVSSQIDAMWSNTNADLLRVGFRNGDRYEYDLQTDTGLIEEMLEEANLPGGSIGKALNRHVKAPGFPYRKLVEGEDY